MLITIQNRGTITISSDLRAELGLSPGDPLDATIENGRLVLTPVAVIPRTHHLTPSGEQKESEAEDDIRHGRTRIF